MVRLLVEWRAVVFRCRARSCSFGNFGDIDKLCQDFGALIQTGNSAPYELGITSTVMTWTDLELDTKGRGC